MRRLNSIAVSLAAKVGAPEEGLLVYQGDTLVALLVKVDQEIADEAGGIWFAEVGFGPVDAFRHPVFGSIEEGLVWIEQQLVAP